MRTSSFVAITILSQATCWLGAQSTGAPAPTVTSDQKPSTVSSPASYQVVNAMRTANFKVGVSAFYPKIDSNVRLDNVVPGDGTPIDLEQDLGYQSDELTWGAQINYEFANRWHLALDYIGLDRDATSTIDKDIDWGDEFFPVNSTVSSYMDIDIVRLAVGYSIWSAANYEVGVDAGVHMLDVGVGIDLVGTVGQDNVGISQDAATGVIFPLPNIGFYWNQDLSEHWYLDSRLDWFGLKVGDWGGSLWNFKIAANYAFTPHFSVGLGFTYFDLNVEYDQEDWQGEMDFAYYGPELQFVFGF